MNLILRFENAPSIDQMLNALEHQKPIQLTALPEGCPPLKVEALVTKFGVKDFGMHNWDITLTPTQQPSKETELPEIMAGVYNSQLQSGTIQVPLSMNSEAGR